LENLVRWSCNSCKWSNGVDCCLPAQLGWPGPNYLKSYFTFELGLTPVVQTGVRADFIEFQWLHIVRFHYQIRHHYIRHYFWTGIIVLIVLYLVQGHFVIIFQMEKLLPATVHYKIPYTSLVLALAQETCFARKRLCKTVCCSSSAR
jgi:hypothetical protein